MRRLRSCLPWVRRSGRPMCASAISAAGIRSQSTTTAAATGSTVEPSLFSVRVNTCSQLYMDMYERQGNLRKPLTGVDFDVVYADTMPTASASVPVVLALHGVAGSHLNFYPLLPYLTAPSSPPVRIIMPNLPGCGYTALDPSKVFEHSDAERAQLILDFLNELNISRINVLVTHSAGVNTALYLHETFKLIQSFVFVNPNGLRPVKMMKPVPLNRVILSMINVKIIRWLVSVMKDVIFKEMEIFKTMHIDAFEVVARTLLFIDYEKIKRMFLALILQRYPVILATSRNDAIVGTDVNAELMNLFGFDDDEDQRNQLVRYDANGAPNRTNVSEVTFPKGLLFERGNHYLMKAYPEILANEILNLLACVDSSWPVVLQTRGTVIQRVSSPIIAKI